MSRSVVPLWRGAPGQGVPYEMVGTAFWVSEDGILATAAHLVQSGTVMIPLKGKGIPCRVLYDSFEVRGSNTVIEWDIALLKAEGAEELIHAVKLSEQRKFRIGDPIATFGFFDRGFTYTIGNTAIISGLLTKGIISFHHALVIGTEIHGTRFVVDMTAGPGSSGSPLFDPETGSVIAILSSGKKKDIASFSEEVGHWAKDAISLGIVNAEPVLPILKWLRTNGKIDY